MHEYENENGICAICGNPESYENHLTQADLDFAASMYQLYQGEKRAGLLDWREEHEAAYGDEHNENCPLCGIQLDVDFIRDEERGK